MPGRRYWKWAAVLALSSLSGCCWWADRWCPQRQAAPLACQPCAPACCPAPAAAGYATPPAVPANYAPAQQTWANPAPGTTYRVQPTGCLCPQ